MIHSLAKSPAAYGPKERQIFGSFVKTGILGYSIAVVEFSAIDIGDISLPALHPQKRFQVGKVIASLFAR
jgi:hypothetical protein